MPSAFNFAISPFDCLGNEERKLVRNSLDIGYYREGEVILDAGAKPDHLFVIIKGYVQQFDGDELITTYGPDDSFDGRAVVAGKAHDRFVAMEEVVAYLLSRQTVTELISSNATFGALLFSDLSRKLSALSERQSQHELQSLTMARVEQAFIRPPASVSAEADIVSVARAFHEHRTNCVLVQDDQSTPPRIGIFTTTGLQTAILHGTPLHELKVREIANFDLITISPDAPLFDALALMIRHKIHRLVVAEESSAEGSTGRLVGILHQLDLLSFLSNHSYLISLQILEAENLEALKPAADQINRLITLLYRGGTKVAQIARLVQELNAKLLERAWELIAPRDLIANSCLFVMGSEGRGEQLLKTDQDNGLILRDGYVCPHDLPAICQRFTDALIDYGFPACPGFIMVNNPMWRQSVTDSGAMVRQWLLTPEGDNVMQLAIFLDAHPICGDTALLGAVRKELYRTATDNAGLLSRFASAIDAFNQGSVWWNKLLLIGENMPREQLDLKKNGLFPIVHGVRAMALEHQIMQSGTVARIEALVKLGKFPADLSTDVIDSLHFFMSLRLKAGLEAQETGREAGNGVDVEKLSSLDRDLLKDTLGVVKKFKAMLHHRYHLDSL
jgi:CBS domain-containing protein